MYQCWLHTSYIRRSWTKNITHEFLTILLIHAHIYIHACVTRCTYECTVTQKTFIRSFSHICIIMCTCILHLRNSTVHFLLILPFTVSRMQSVPNFTCSFRRFKYFSELLLPYTLYCRTLFSIRLSATYWNDFFSFSCVQPLTWY